MTPPSTTLTALGAEASIAVSAFGADGGAVTNPPFEWVSRTTGVITMLDGATNPHMRVRAVAPGVAWLVVTSGNASDSARIAVQQTVARLDVDPGTMLFDALGDHRGATVSAFDANNQVVASPDIVWSSRDNAVASVNSTGRVTAAGPGDVWVIAEAGSAADSLRVTVQQVIQSVVVSPAFDTIQVTGTHPFRATARARYRVAIAVTAFEWATNDPWVARVSPLDPSERASVRAMGGGIATITGAAAGRTGAAYITVPEGTVVGADVGYYNLSYGQGAAAQVAPIEAAGGIPVQLSDLAPGDLAQVGVLFVENPDNGGYASSYITRLASIEAWVAGGGVLIFHDRHVTGAAGILPGGAGFTMVRSPGTNIDVGDGSTLVTNGPGGVVTDSNLDGGSFSHHGWIEAASLPGNAVKILTTGAPGRIVTASYRHGNGFVIYSTIPLDFYLTGSSPAAFRLVYAPNVVAYGMQLRGVSPSAMAARALQYVPAQDRDVRASPRAPGKRPNSAVNDR